MICHAVFMLCLSSFLLQNMSLNVGFQFEGRSLKYSVSMFQRKVDPRLTTENHKPAVMLRVPVGGLKVGGMTFC